MALQSITVKELAVKVFQQDDVFILDVRSTDRYEDWRIEGEGVTSVNIPYFDLLDDGDYALRQLPKDQEVIVICNKEPTSKMVAEKLMEAGRTDVYYVEGGMRAWSEHLVPVKIGDLNRGGALYQFVRIGKGCLSYVIESNGEAAIVDSMRMTDVYEQFARDHDLRITHVIDTHLHADHISGGRRLSDNLEATYWLPPKDAEEVQFHYSPLENDDVITVGDTTVRIQALYSPGHTIGSTSLIIDEQYLLSGDILFVDSIGRPDLAGKADDWVSDLQQTLHRRYAELDPTLIVLPAHYARTSEMDDRGRVCARLGDLYKRNADLQITDAEAFREKVTNNLPPQPNAYKEIRQTNMGKRQPNDEEQVEMEIGPNRCAVS